MSTTTRHRVIASLCAMFDAYHGNDTTPQWLLDLHNSSDDATLLARLANWHHNCPEQWQQHGLYVL